MATAMIGQVVELMQDDEAFASFVSRQIDKDPQLITREIVSDLRKKGLSEESATMLVHMNKPKMDALLAQPFGAAAQQLTAAFRQFLGEDSARLNLAVRNAQLKALNSEVAPAKRVEMFSHLKYVVCNHVHAPLPLGDSIVVTHIEGKRPFKTVISTDDRILASYLPLSPALFLCAHAAGFEPNSIDLPAAVAECSSEYLLAQDHDARMVALQQRIGYQSALLDESEMELLMQDTFADFASNPPNS